MFVVNRSGEAEGSGLAAGHYSVDAAAAQVQVLQSQILSASRTGCICHTPP